MHNAKLYISWYVRDCKLRYGQESTFDNTKEDGCSIFPYNAFNVHILSTDHKLPHFHILSNGWNISFYISNGELYKINKEGKDSKTYKYIIENVKIWLTSKCAIIPQITNQQNGIAIWEQLHS